MSFVALILACTAPSDLPEAQFDPDSDWMWNNPWPSDSRLRADGTPDLSNFPNPHGIQLLDTYVALGESQRGWGNNSGITFPIDGYLDLSTLPDPAASLEQDSPLLLVNVDPRSPYWGERLPVQWHWERTGSQYIDPQVLTIAPVYGFPLRPATRYAAVLTDALVSRPDAFDAALSDDPLYADLEDALLANGVRLDQVGIATVFTAGDPVSEMARIATWLQEEVEPPDLNLEVTHRYDRTHFSAYKTHYPSPVFTHGARPYTVSGGEFRFTEDGTPQVSRWDDMRLQVCAPHDLSSPPEGGWPVVIYQHGTGGDYDGFCNGNSFLEAGSRIVSAGAIGLGIDQSLHGIRSGAYDEAWPEVPSAASDLAHFNIVNPHGARANFRQGGLDAIYLAAALAREQVVMTTDAGEPIPLDPDRVLFMGHSQGGLTGALALPWLSRDVQATVLSGAGGVLAVTVVKRKDPLDFAALVEAILQLEEGDSLHTLHPVVSLVQALVDVTDPVNYAPFWYSQPGWWESRPANVLLTSGTRDHATDYETAIALAAAARMPVMHPRASQTLPIDLRGLPLVQGPVLDDAIGYDGTPVTSALSQWVGGSHWVLFEELDAARMYETFLSTAAEGRPTIYREP